MQKGVFADRALRRLMKEHEVRVVDVAAATGIPPGSITAYSTKNHEARRRLGLDNGRILAEYFGVELSRLGLFEEEEAGDELVGLRRALAALETSVELLSERVTTLESARATPRPAQRARKRKAG